MKIYHILADIVFWFHWAWLITLIIGSPFFIFNRTKWYSWCYWIMGISTGLSDLIFWGCPLTLLENTFRMQYNPKTAYKGSFVCKYIKEYFDFQLPAEYVTLTLVGIVFLSMILSILFFPRQSKKQETI